MPAAAPNWRVEYWTGGEFCRVTATARTTEELMGWLSDHGIDLERVISISRVPSAR